MLTTNFGEGTVEIINSFFSTYNHYIGTYLIMILLVPTGVYFAFKLKFLHVTQFFHSIKVISGKYDDPNEEGDITHFKALTTALSATVGTGNIVGVALAIYWGGPGAIFWMWVTGFFGMILKFAECTLSMKYRVIHADGTASGGPMYYIERGLKDRLGSFAKILAVLFAVATVISSMGIGNMAQTNSMSGALFQNYHIPTWISAIVIATLIFLVIVGGIRRIATVTSRLVPFMALFYVICSIIIIMVNIQEIPFAIQMIIHDAFTGTAAAGGFVGSTFLFAARFGIARGLFSNEAGQGSAAIAHAAAKTKFPVREGLVASIGPFVDTLIICSLTALVIMVTGAWKSGIKGVPMTIEAFSLGLKPLGLSFLGQHIIALGLFLFALSTAISWSYYGDRAIGYLFGPKGIKPYRIFYSIMAAFGAVWGLDLVWNITDMFVSFMTIPNLIALLLLSPVVVKEVKMYLNYRKEEKLQSYNQRTVYE